MSTTETAILERLIVPERLDLTPEAAAYLLTLHFSADDERRMNDLAAKARAGNLTTDEAKEVESYHHVSHMIALMQSKARRSLKRTNTNGTH